MSLLDSFPDDSSTDDELPLLLQGLSEGECDRPKRGLCASFDVGDSSDEEDSDDDLPCPMALPLPVVAPPPAVEARAGGAHGRGRPRGSAVLRRLRAEAAAEIPKKSRREIASAAAKARWAKRTEEREVHEAPSVPSPPAVSDAVVPFVPAGPSDDGTMVAFSEHFSTALEKRLSEIPQFKKEPELRVETEVVLQCTKILSTKVLSELLKVDADTVARKQRLLAATVVLAKRFRAFTVFEQVHALLGKLRPSFRPLVALQKVKYDGVSFRLVLDDVDHKDDDPEAPESTAPQQHEEKDCVVAKLLQVGVTYACLWKVGSHYMSVETKSPTTIRPLDADDARSIAHGLDKEAGFPPWLKEAFEFCVRLVTADDAGANGVADLLILLRNDWQLLLKFVCGIHKEHRVAEIQLNTFLSDSRGLLHSTLASQYAGVFRRIRRCMKNIVKKKMRYRRCAESGSTAGETKYRQAVLAAFGEDPGARCAGPQAAKRQRRWMCLTGKLNGNWEDPDHIDHWCTGDHCCKDERDCYRQICKYVLNPLQRPPGWGTNRWLGSLNNHKWHGLWIAMHNLYGQAWEMMNDKQDDKDMPAPDDGGGSDDEGLCGHGEDSAAESEHEEHQVVAVDEADAVDMVEFELEDVAPEASSFKRQSTYHGNTRAWLRTQPLRRIWVLVEVHRVQQDTQKAMLKQVGTQWEERESADPKSGRAGLANRSGSEVLV